MKITFQNVRSINDEKVRFLKNTLHLFDLLCLSELNKCYDFNKTEINDNEFQYHTDKDINRIGVMATNTLNLSTFSKGLILDQDRERKDKVAIQTFIYKIRIKSRDIFIENVYITPDTKNENLQKLISHLQSQSKKFKFYMVGGDFNLNWRDKKIKDLFRSLHLHQVVKQYTRVQNYKKKIRDVDGKVIKELERTSKTIIDLVFVTDCLKPFVKSVEVEQLLDSFDHKAVTIELDFPASQYYRYVEIPLDPLKRPNPDEEQVKSIKQQLKDLKPKSLDGFLGNFRYILDKIIPVNPRYSTIKKKIFKTPLSKEIVAEIEKKQRLSKYRKLNKYNWNKYKKQRNKIVNLLRKARDKYCNDQIKKYSDVKDIQNEIDRLQNHFSSRLHNDKQKLEVQGFSGQKLAEKMAKFYKSRAEDLVTDKEMAEAGLPDEPLRPGEYLEPMKPIIFPHINEINKFIPSKKVSNCHGPGQISSKIVSIFWDETKFHLNNLLKDSKLVYPFSKQGYYQRTIPKSTDVKILKDLRPLGILNPIPKYIINKVVFKQIRVHINPILNKRHNFSFRGTHMCIIHTFDKILETIQKNQKTFLVKYDFSNAFGTLNHKTLVETAKKLQMPDNLIEFLKDYLRNQKIAQTVVKDQFGSYLSEQTLMNRGAVQGQIGADICFIIQQLCLKELDTVYRSSYVDDINDIVCGKTFQATQNIIKENETALSLQSKKIGFKLNADKTEYIPFNIKGENLKDVICTRFSKLLGLPFVAMSTGFDMTPAVNMLVNRLTLRGRKMHILRQYVKNIKTLIYVARCFIYQSIGELHLIITYSRRPVDDFNKIQVKINDIIRATGLSIETPQPFLDMCMGSCLRPFINHSILLNGIKILGMDSLQNLDRAQNFRSNFPVGGYLHKFTKVWNNELTFEQKFSIIQMKSLDQIKYFLKKSRRLRYVPSIHVNYKWVRYKPKD